MIVSDVPIILTPVKDSNGLRLVDISDGVEYKKLKQRITEIQIFGKYQETVDPAVRG